MVDPNAIVMQVNAGNVPPQWRVLRAKTGFFIGNAIWYGILGIAALAGIAYLLISGSYISYGPKPTNAQGEMLWQLANIGVLLVLVIFFFAVSIRRIVGLGSVAQQMLVLMPEGFIVTTAKGIQSYPFANLNGITAANTDDGEVVLKMRRADNGQQIEYQVDGRFGSPKTVAGNIVAAQGQFTTAMIQARQQPPQQ
jgi:hypothetical protein